MFRHAKETNPGFTLLELTVTLAIIGVLALTVFSSHRYALIKSGITKSQTDFLLIKNGLSAYYIDHGCYPATMNFLSMIHSLEIHQATLLTTPFAYVAPVPVFPWYGKMGVEYSVSSQNKGENTVRYNRYANYILTIPTEKMVQNKSTFLWSISSGGPVSVNHATPQRALWYSPTNGILSFGGFWSDSRGNESFQ